MIRIFIALCCLLYAQNNEPVITWSEDYQLTWQDFKAAPKPKQSAAAITASGISFSYSIKQSGSRVVSFTTEVFTHFYPEQSWYKPELANAHILAHEQLHFDITELYARKFRQHLAQLKPSRDIKKRLDNLLGTINKQLAERQNTYDAETNNSRNEDTQVQWHETIENELLELATYKSQP